MSGSVATHGGRNGHPGYASSPAAPRGARAPQRAAASPAAARAADPLAAPASPGPALQRCACGGGCPACRAKAAGLAALPIHPADDVYEREADRVADTVMRGGRASAAGATPALPSISRLQRSASGEGGASEAPPIVHDVLRSPGQPLDPASRAFLEPRFGRGFGDVRVHTDTRAAESARAVDAIAYTVGNNVVFGAGAYRPGSAEGRRLLAHELTHVVQQGDAGSAPAAAAAPALQRQTTDFCTRFATTGEADSTELQAQYLFIPAITTAFGTEVGILWNSYINRRPGASLTRRIFSSSSSSVVQGFAAATATTDRQNELADIVANSYGSRCPRLPRPNRWVTVPLTNYLSPAQRDFPINFNDPFSIPGNIAGGVGSSDAGPDTRRAGGTVSFKRHVDAAGNTTSIEMRTNFSFVVRDAVDFCPGDPGAGFEQFLTVPLSRLEASGRAYDVPFEVRFSPASTTRDLDPAVVTRCFPPRTSGSGSGTGAPAGSGASLLPEAPADDALALAPQADGSDDAGAGSEIV